MITPVNRELEATMETVKAEAVPGKEITVETETPMDEERAEETEVAVETGDNEVAVETAPTVPHAHGAGGETVPVIIIAYPLQTSLDCPHCPTQFPGDKIEDLHKHLQDYHPDDQRDWLFLCAFCANGMNEEEDAIQHMLREHRDTLRGLPRTGILQARDRLITPTESGPSPMPPLPGDTQEDEDEEVLPLPPPIYPPLPQDEPTRTPPPLPPGTPPPISSDAPGRRQLM